MNTVRARVTYPSGRTFKYYGWENTISLRFERRDGLTSPDTFTVQTWDTERSKPKHGQKGLYLEFDTATMDQIVAEYQKLFKS